MSFITWPTNLLQIFCKIILNPTVIVESIFNPDNNFWGNFKVSMGLHNFHDPVGA